MRGCDYPDCPKPHRAAGFCTQHYQRKLKYGDPGFVHSQGAGRGIPAAERFWSRVNRNGPIPEHRPELGPCWLWTGPPNSNGYGTLRVRGQIIGAHRYASELAAGHPIPMEYEPDHLCRVRMCVRSTHLEVVTAEENRRRSTALRSARMAARTHCKHGHLWQPETTYIHPTSGSRICLACFPSWARKG